jgi:hypothetical protein
MTFGLAVACTGIYFSGLSQVKFCKLGTPVSFGHQKHNYYLCYHQTIRKLYRHLYPLEQLVYRQQYILRNVKVLIATTHPSTP